VTVVEVEVGGVAWVGGSAEREGEEEGLGSLLFVFLLLCRQEPLCIPSQEVNLCTNESSIVDESKTTPTCT
jgi:hypothetical protein